MTQELPILICYFSGAPRVVPLGFSPTLSTVYLEGLQNPCDSKHLSISLLHHLGGAPIDAHFIMAWWCMRRC